MTSSSSNESLLDVPAASAPEAPSAAAAAMPATEEKLGARLGDAPASAGARLLTAASAAAAGLDPSGGAPDSAARRNPNRLDPRCHAMVSITRSSMALKCFFTSRGIVGSARTKGSMMPTTSNASRPRSRGMAGNLSVAVLYDATTTSMAHAKTARTKRLEPANARKLA